MTKTDIVFGLENYKRKRKWSTLAQLYTLIMPLPPRVAAVEVHEPRSSWNPGLSCSVGSG